jgi:pilus assembly protein CpaB
MDAKAQAAPKPRLVANGNFEKGRVIQAGDFRLAESSDPNPGPAKGEDLIGRSLTEDLADGQAFAERHLSKLRRLSLPGGVPAGMRAVTVHVADSSSVVDLLEAGDRVDLQSVTAQPRFNAPSVYQVRTVLENVTVYGIGPKVNPGGMLPRAVLTLLASPGDAEKIVLADASSQLRITLRNRADTALNVPKAPQAVVTTNFRAGAAAPPREFEVLLVEVEGEALAAAGAAQGAPQARGGDWNGELANWQSARWARLWASSKLDAAQGGEVTWRGEDPGTSVRIRLDAVSAAGSSALAFRVEPEVQLGQGGVRRGEVRLKLGARESALVSGLVPPEQFAAWRARFAPGRAASDAPGGLVVVIKPLP